MTWKWSHILSVFALAGVLMFAGCADEDDDDGGGPGPGPTNPLVGDWSAYEGVDELGADELFFRFESDSTYLFRARYNAVISNETGTWTADADSIHLTVLDIDGEAADTSYSVWYDFLPGDDSLRIRHVFDDVYEVRYARE